MTTRSLHLAKDLSLPLDAVTQTFCILGKRGSGKTNGATVLVEELLKAELAVVVLDPVDAWWGLKSSFDGKSPGLPIYIFGGDHADLPLEPTAGSLIADLVAKEHLPAILSMKQWGVGERARFVTDFAKRLLQVNTTPLMMVLEEADAFIPQRPAKGEEAMLGAMDRLVRWGRQSGVGCTLVTQRSAKANKDGGRRNKKYSSSAQRKFPEGRREIRAQGRPARPGRKTARAARPGRREVQRVRRGPARHRQRNS